MRTEQEIGEELRRLEAFGSDGDNPRNEEARHKANVLCWVLKKEDSFE